MDTPILVTEYVVIPGRVRRAAAEARLMAAQRVHASNGFVGPGGLRREIGDDHMRPFLGKPHRCSLPDTLMRWYKRLIAAKCDGSKKRCNLGRPRVAEEVELLVIRMAEENPTWGYRRIQGALANLGHAIDKITVRNILRRHHINPAPKRSKDGMSWTQFLTLHWEVLAATDCFTVEVATWHGLMTYYVLVVMELSTRRVEIAGITPHPTAEFMQQCARQLTEHFDGFLLDKRYLIHDRDRKFTEAFDQLLRDSGVEPVVLPPRSPNLNAYCERFVAKSSGPL